jgi:hypothetical protein
MRRGTHYRKTGEPRAQNIFTTEDTEITENKHRETMYQPTGANIFVPCAMAPVFSSVASVSSVVILSGFSSNDD